MAADRHYSMNVFADRPQTRGYQISRRLPEGRSTAANVVFFPVAFEMTWSALEPILEEVANESYPICVLGGDHIRCMT